MPGVVSEMHGRLLENAAGPIALVAYPLVRIHALEEIIYLLGNHVPDPFALKGGGSCRQ